MSNTDTTSTEEESSAETPSGDKRLEFADAVELPTDKDTVWDLISDPEVLSSCVPGAEEIDRRSERVYDVHISRGVSHLTVSLEGEMELVEMNEPDWVVASGVAHDTKTGSDFDILAAMEMTEGDDETTILSYSAEVGFSGGVSSLGPGLLRPIVKRDVEAYFENVRARVEADE
ncbi:CoxG family protein [Haloferax sp. YSMS24]|uniref:CoxG family protein n=1 Tax=Haloferax sp. YSMS24 TaxID=3388425 RepID=UPI00398CCFD7